MAKEPSVNDPLDEVIGELIEKLRSSAVESARTSELLASAMDRIAALERRLDQMEGKAAAGGR